LVKNRRHRANQEVLFAPAADRGRITGDSEVMALNDYSAVNRPNLGSQGEVSKLHRILHPDCLRVRRKRSNTMTLYV